MRNVLWSRWLVLIMACGIVAASVGGLGRGSSLMGIEGRGQRRLGPAAVYTAVQVSASGRLTPTAFNALTCPRASIGVDGDGKRYRSIEVGAASTGAADSTWTTTVYVAKAGFASGGGNNATDWELQLVGSFVSTVGTGVGATDSGAVLTTERIVKTIVWTPATVATTPPGISAYLVSAYASAPIVTYSPGGALPAKIMFPDLGNGAFFVLDPGSTGGSSVVFYAEAGT